MAVDIVTGEKFPHLKRAPITEAVIEVRGRAETPWDETQIRTALVDELPDYPNHSEERELSPAFSFAPATPSSLPPTVDLSWKGLRFRTLSLTFLQLVILVFRKTLSGKSERQLPKSVRLHCMAEEMWKRSSF